MTQEHRSVCEFQSRQSFFQTSLLENTKKHSTGSKEQTQKSPEKCDEYFQCVILKGKADLEGGTFRETVCFLSSLDP